MPFALLPHAQRVPSDLIAREKLVPAAKVVASGRMPEELKGEKPLVTTAGASLDTNTSSAGENSV